MPASFMRLKSFMTESKLPAFEKHEIMLPYDTTSLSIPILSMAFQNLFASRTLQTMLHHPLSTMLKLLVSKGNSFWLDSSSCSASGTFL
uniref:Uncharacterized protein n=1 Tax=Arundo donax TaxID=35708 RepID=A0A0A9FYI2_ARUDO